MEQLSANTEKRTQQIGIFNEYSVPLVPDDELGEHVLTYDNFVNLISDSRKRLTSKPTDHLFNLNRVLITHLVAFSSLWIRKIRGI